VIIVPKLRTGRFSVLLGTSFLHYVPLLGYRASMFNLVYANNVASQRAWDQLGFVRLARIPEGGRVRTADGSREEYVDVIVYYKNFEKVQVPSRTSYDLTQTHEKISARL
jgi:hypothetical protein